MDMSLPFSETWLISLASRPDRYSIMRSQIDNYFGWEVKDHRTVIHPCCNEIFSKGIGYLNRPNAFACTWEHYTLIKSAYLRGLDSICVMEDDVSFYRDISVWEDYMSNLPSNWDILRICCLRGSTEQDYFSRRPGLKWAREFISTWGTGCYALSRNGMEYMINSIDSHLQPIDHPLFKICGRSGSGINSYIPNIPLGLCLDDSLCSDININSGPNFYFRDIKDLDYSMYGKEKGV